MDLVSLIYLLLLAIVISVVFSYGFRARGPWGTFWTFFAVVFLAIWAADVWVSPVGPYWRNVYWLPPLAVGVLIALLLAAATPSPKARERVETERHETPEESTRIALSAFFWIMLLFLIAAVIAGFMFGI
jgi:uncharacterized membrane protein